MPEVQARVAKLKTRHNWFVIQDERIIEFLSDQTRRDYLRVFMGRTRSVSQAAKETNAELHVMRYFVDQLLGFGLLNEVGAKKRQGREMKLYRAVSDAFVAELPQMEANHLLMLFSANDWGQRQKLLSGMIGQIHTPGMRWVTRFYTSDGVDTVIDFVPAAQKESLLSGELEGDNSPPVWYNNLTLKLEFEDAKALQRELVSLYRRYEEKQRQNLQSNFASYTLQLGLSALELPSDTSVTSDQSRE
jgi:hypothetical protein